MRRLDGKVVMVTGATRGMGRATAERLGAEGACLVLTARTEDDGREVDEVARGRGRRGVRGRRHDRRGPEEVAAFGAFLLSDEARFVTGAALAVDGGATAG